MADPAFDPDAYLADEPTNGPAFDPDAYLADEAPTTQFAAPVVEAPPSTVPATGGQPSYLPQIEVSQAPFESNSSEGQGALPLVAVPLDPVVQGLRKFKKSLIDPIVKFHQAQNRKLYFGDAFPDEGFGGNSGQPIDYNSPGQMLREAAPGIATVAENLGSLAIGETGYNTWHEDKADSMNPKARKFYEQTRSTGKAAAEVALPQVVKNKYPNATEMLGDVGTAAMQSTLHALSESGLILLPGAGQGAAVQGLTGGLLSGMVSPDGDPVNDAIAGGGLGGAFGVVGKFVGKLNQLRKGKLTVPVGVVEPERMGDFLDAIKVAPEPLIPSKDLSDASFILKSGNDTKAVRIGKDGVTAQPIKLTQVVPKDVPVIEDALPEGYFDTLTAAEEAALREEGLALGLGKQETLVAKGVGDDWDALAGTQDIFGKSAKGEGLVLAIEGGDGSGTARLYDIADPKLHAQILETRMLSEVTLPDGRKVLGYPGPSDILLMPDADEMIPGAAKQDINLAGMDVEIKPVTRPRIKELLREREYLLREAENAAATAEADAAASARDVALGGNGDGSKIPPPPPHDAPPPIPPQNPHNVSPTEEIAVRWWDRISQSKLAKGLLNPTARGPRDVSDLAMMSQSVDTFERLRMDSVKAFEKRVPEVSKMAPAAQRQAMQNIERFVVGDIKLDQLKALHPELAASSFKMLEEAKLQTAVDEQRLINLGILREGQSSKDLGIDPTDDIGYLTKLYWRNLLGPGEWRRIMMKDEATMKRLVSQIQQDVYSTPEYRLRTAEQKKALAERHLDYLLGNPEKMAEAKANPEGAYKKISLEASNSLKARKDLRDWEKVALGEIDNPFIRMAEARTRQKQLVLQGEMWKSVSENPKLSVREDAATPQQIKDWVPVPANPNKYGLTAGMRVTPETWEAMVQAPLAQKNMSTFLTKSVNAIKYGQTVGNPGSWVSNFVSNAQGAAMSNMVNPFASPYLVGKGMLEFGRDLEAHKLAPGVMGDVRRNRFQKFMELGIVGSDYSTAEFRESSAKWQKLLEKEASTFNGKVNPIDLFPRMLSGAKRGKEQLARWYGSIDTMWKYSTALNGLKKAGMDLDTGLITDKKKALRFISDRYMPGMSDENVNKQVYLEVAARINKSFPQLDRVGSAVNKLGQAAGIVNPYIKVQSELLRNYGTLPKRMLTEPGMAANMLGYGTLVGTAYFLNKELRQANGINQEEVDQAFASAPPSVARFKIGAMVLPWRTKDGRLTLIDLTQLFEPLTYLRGSPEAAAPGKMLQNLVSMPANGGLLEPELQDMLAMGGIGDPAYRPKAPAEWQEGGARLLWEAVNRLGPGIIRNTYNTLERGQVGFSPKGVKGPEQDAQSGLVTGANLILGPNRFQEIGGQAQHTRARQFADAQIQQADAELSRIGAMNEGQSTGPLTAPLNKAQAEARARAVLEERKAALQKLQQSTKGTP